MSAVHSQTEALYGNLAESAAEVVILHDHQGEIRYCSPATETVLGRPGTSLRNRLLEEFVHPDDRSTLRDAISEQTSQHHAVEISFRAARNNNVWLQAKLQASPTNTGEFVCIVRQADDHPDQSQRLQTDEGKPEVFSHNTFHQQQTTTGDSRSAGQTSKTDGKDGTWLGSTLTIRNSERDRADSTPRPQNVSNIKHTKETFHPESGELAHWNRLNLASELATVLTHELNQPLTAISIQAELARRVASPVTRDDASVPQLTEALEEIKTQTQRAIDIVRNLRSFISKTPQDHSIVSVNEIIRETQLLLARQTDESGVSLDLELSDSLPPVAADSVQLHQVFSNLLRNGLDAFSEEETQNRRINIRTSSTESHVLITIEDNASGVGEDPEVIFKSFYTTKSDGMGVGLAICRTIIDAHGGRIWAENRPGGGAVFYVKLPILRNDL